MNTEEKFTEFYKEYYEEIYKYVRHRIPNAQMAEDVVQETFYTAYKKRDVFLEHPYPRRWLLCTARNKVHEICRKMKRWAAAPLGELSHEIITEEIGYDYKELELAVLRVLSEEDWQMLRGYYLYGVKASELAEQNGITEGNMRVRLTRLKQKLRSAIEH